MCSKCVVSFESGMHVKGVLLWVVAHNPSQPFHHQYNSTSLFVKIDMFHEHTAWPMQWLHTILGITTWWH